MAAFVLFLTCSVHPVPVWYRFSYRPNGSRYHPAIMGSVTALPRLPASCVLPDVQPRGGF